MAQKNIISTCSECGFSSEDYHLVKNHSCDVQRFGGRCEDYPCCGHENGDCNGLLYGSDEAIMDREYARIKAEWDGYEYENDEPDEY